MTLPVDRLIPVLREIADTFERVDERAHDGDVHAAAVYRGIIDALRDAAARLEGVGRVTAHLEATAGKERGDIAYGKGIAAEFVRDALEGNEITGGNE